MRWFYMGISEKHIEDLKGLKFNVPSYQRGYRWTSHEVKTLLDDLYNHNKDFKYCLQPLIVKKISDNIYDVVDGQQRLTTIYIFLKFMSAEFNNGRRRSNQYNYFELEYETRTQSGTYLKELDFDTYEELINYDIDASHFSGAFGAIDEWLEQDGINPNNALNDIYKVLTESVFFIWYEIDESENPINIFTKVNMGKIPLTNAELIKALVLDKNNYPDDNESDRIHRAISWNQIEHRLQETSFWQFLTNNEIFDTRIDYLFNLLEFGRPGASNKDRYATFYSLYKRYMKAENKPVFITEFWSSVQLLFEELSNWYTDLDKFHLIGYLLSLDSKNIVKVFEATREKKKSEAYDSLKELALETIPDISGIDTVSYGDKRVRALLLLFNLVTLINKSDKQYRFPFDIYKTDKWDIEHIHASADETAEADDSLGNLTLLDASTNRSYGKSPFFQKRKVIIEVDAKGKFVPVCTRNVFLKVYSKEISDFDVWSENDKSDYISAMKQELHKFFENVGE